MTTKDRARAELAAAPKKYFIRYTLNHRQVMEMFVGDSLRMKKAMERAMASALGRGETVELADGTQIWRARVIIIDTTKEGSEQYTWHEDGERVRAELVECRKKKGDADSIERRVLRRVWVTF